jgi:SAM-dependent methyltransferase
MIRKIIIRARLLLAHNVVVEWWFSKQRRRILTREFIESDEYTRVMMTHFDPATDGIDSAERLTTNFKYRHFKKNRVLGAWRWLGVYEKRAILTKYVFSKDLNGVDIGGVRGPISLGVKILDRLKEDIFARPVKYSDISQIPDSSLDYAWSSHTLEHIDDIDGFIGRLSAKLKPEGKLLALVPAYTCRRWRAGQHEYADVRGASNHLYTFCLSNDKEKMDSPEFVPIDELMARHLRVDLAEMVGDNSIFILATR